MKSEVKARVTTPTQTIRGRVVDAENQSPVKGAAVSIADNQFSTFTDSSGNFSLTNNTRPELGSISDFFSSLNKISRS